MVAPGRVRAGTRLRVLGYLALWLIELVAQGGRVLQFLVQRRQIRERMRQLILDGPIPHLQSLQEGAAADRQVRMTEEEPREECPPDEERRE